MDQKEETTYINENESLKKDDLKTYEYRAIEQGRKIKNNGMILPSKTDKMPVDRLCDDEGVLESWHRDAGIRFWVLSQLSQGKHVSFNPPSEDPVEQQISPSIKVRAINHQLSEEHQELIEMVLFVPATENDIRGLVIIATKLQQAFDALCGAMKTDNIEAAVDIIRKKELDKRNQATQNVKIRNAIVATKFSQPRVE